MALDMNGIKNENEFFTTHYIAAMLEGDLEPVVKGWKEAAEASARPHRPAVCWNGDACG